MEWVKTNNSESKQNSEDAKRNGDRADKKSSDVLDDMSAGSVQDKFNEINIEQQANDDQSTVKMSNVTKSTIELDRSEDERKTINQPSTPSVMDWEQNTTLPEKKVQERVQSTEKASYGTDSDTEWKKHCFGE